jgi:hypothetical protein
VGAEGAGKYFCCCCLQAPLALYSHIAVCER